MYEVINSPSNNLGIGICEGENTRACTAEELEELCAEAPKQINPKCQSEFVRILGKLWPFLERNTQVDIYTQLLLREDIDKISLRILECAIHN